MFAHGETVTRLRPTLTPDRYGGTRPDWTAPDEVAIPGCAFVPGTSVEPTEQGRRSVVTQPEVYDPSFADVKAGDRLVVRGLTYDVEGHPQDWRSPLTGWRPARVVSLKEVDG